MLLRRVIQHFKQQEWTAIGIDFLIVVVGVVVGLQANNWNEAQAFDRLEREHLVQLRSDVEKAIADTTSRIDVYLVVTAAGERALAFLAKDETCAENCWPVLVDFFVASQWIDVSVSQTTYDAMQRMGLPRSRAVVTAVEAYHAQNDGISSTLNERPAYRTLVRELIPAEAQRALWAGCHTAKEGLETVIEGCEAGLSNEITRSAVDAIRADPGIRRALNHWTAIGYPTVPYLLDQNIEGEKVIAAINAELGVRP